MKTVVPSLKEKMNQLHLPSPESLAKINVRTALIFMKLPVHALHGLNVKLAAQVATTTLLNVVVSLKKSIGQSMIMISTLIACLKNQNLSRLQESRAMISVIEAMNSIGMLAPACLKLSAFLDAMKVNSKILSSTVDVLTLIQVIRFMIMVLELTVGLILFLSQNRCLKMNQLH